MWVQERYPTGMDTQRGKIVVQRGTSPDVHRLTEPGDPEWRQTWSNWETRASSACVNFYRWWGSKSRYSSYHSYRYFVGQAGRGRDLLSIPDTIPRSTPLGRDPSGDRKSG